MQNKIVSIQSFFLSICLVVSLVGCLAKDDNGVWKSIEPLKKFQIHEVQWSEESLPMIAQWYTGSKENWKKLGAANPNIVPDHLAPGDRILLPPRLLKTSNSMPQEFITEFHLPPPELVPHQKKRKPIEIEIEIEEDEFEMFGPK